MVGHWIESMSYVDFMSYVVSLQNAKKLKFVSKLGWEENLQKFEDLDSGKINQIVSKKSRNIFFN